MEHKEGFFFGVRNTRLYWQAWLPEDPKAIVEIIHGFAEHSGRYQNVVNQLVPMDIAVYAYDHRGHGKSEGPINFVEMFDDYIQDELMFNEHITTQYSDIPLFLLGHSMGSGIALHVAHKRENTFHGLVLSGAGTKIGGNISPFLKAISGVISKIAKKMVVDPKLDSEKLSHDSAVVQAHREDPMVRNKQITLRLGYESMRYFENLPEIAKQISIPVLIQRGNEDRTVEGFDSLKNAFSTNDLSVYEYEGLFHEVYNEKEPDRTRVLRDLEHWISNHL